MKLIVNGENRNFPDELTIKSLLELLKLDPRATAVLQNEEVIVLSKYGETSLHDGDVLELVRFVAGG